MRQRAVALAALVQAVYLVDGIARKGLADAEDCRTCLGSLFADLHAPVAAIYGGARHLRTGIRIASTLLAGEQMPQARALMTYAAGLMSLEKRLAREDEVRTRLAAGMQRISKQYHYFGDALNPSVIAAVADVYGETLSTLKPRIIVRGKSEYLGQTANTRRVRALLMAGIRAAHLWRRHGGGHFTLLFRRKALLRELRRLEGEITGLDH